MRIATWNVNSLSARLEKVVWWLDRARPDVLLMQETKLADADAPVDAFAAAGYALAHHGEGRWNGVAIASRCAIADVVTNFGQPLRPPRTPEAGDDEPFAEARMVAATCGGVRVVSVYAPNGRVVDSPFYQAKLAWFARLARWLAEARDPNEPLVVGRRLQRRARRTPTCGTRRRATAGPTCRSRSAQAFARLCAWGLADAYRLHHPEPERYTWWDYRAGNFHKNFGMRIDHLLVTAPLAKRTVWAEIDREARKGKPHSLRPRAAGDRRRRAGSFVRRRVGGGRRAHGGPPDPLTPGRHRDPLRRPGPPDRAGRPGVRGVAAAGAGRSRQAPLDDPAPGAPPDRLRQRAGARALPPAVLASRRI